MRFSKTFAPSSQNCYNVPIEDCQVIQKEVQKQDCVPTYVAPTCQLVTETKCQTVTKNTCENLDDNPFIAAYGVPEAVPACTNVEKEVCEDVEVTVPKNEIRTECILVPQENCETVTRYGGSDILCNSYSEGVRVR